MENGIQNSGAYSSNIDFRDEPVGNSFSNQLCGKRYSELVTEPLHNTVFWIPFTWTKTYFEYIYAHYMWNKVTTEVSLYSLEVNAYEVL